MLPPQERLPEARELIERGLSFVVYAPRQTGKTTIARALADALSVEKVALIEQDCYYRDQSHLSFEERAQVNFDHPDAIEMPLLVHHIDELRAGRAIEKPRYDFERHVRADVSDSVVPRPIILIEGILVLADANLRERMDLKLFVDTALDVDDAAGRVEQLARLGGIVRLRDFGVPEAELASLAEDVVARAGARANPREASAEDVLGLLRSIW